MQTCGLLHENNQHYIDHLAPLCSLLKIPLLTNEEGIEELVKKYYPSLKVIHKNYLEFHNFVVREYDLVFYCTTRFAFDSDFAWYQDRAGKRVKSIWCPHGNSDKGRHQSFMEALEKEEQILVYGPKMLDYLKEKNILGKIASPIQIGNYRYLYYLKHKAFLDAKVEEALGEKNKKTILYAPTWQDSEKSSSFEMAYESLSKNLPSSYKLIIKLHPNTISRLGIRFENLIWQCKDKNIFFLKDFPLIYPLLNYVDIYLGDMSSIGYDFLTFDKPLFFINTNKRDPKRDPGLYLYKCGTEIKDIKYLYDTIEKSKDSFSKKRRAVYEYTFGNYRRNI